MPKIEILDQKAGRKRKQALLSQCRLFCMGTQAVDVFAGLWRDDN